MTYLEHIKKENKNIKQLINEADKRMYKISDLIMYSLVDKDGYLSSRIIVSNKDETKFKDIITDEVAVYSDCENIDSWNARSEEKYDFKARVARERASFEKMGYQVGYYAALSSLLIGDIYRRGINKDDFKNNSSNITEFERRFYNTENGVVEVNKDELISKNDAKWIQEKLDDYLVSMYGKEPKEKLINEGKDF